MKMTMKFTRKIHGTENLTPDMLKFEIERGGRFVVFTYCVSILVLSFKRTSGIYFLKAEDSATGKGLLFSLISLLFGWWGIPWGPIWTIGSLVTNTRGGVNVTSQVLAALQPKAA